MTKKMDLSRRSMLKMILWTPPALMFRPDGLFAMGHKIRPLNPPRIVPPGQKIRAAKIGVFHRGGDVLRIFNQRHGDQVEFKAFADLLFLSPDYQMEGFPGVPCFRDYREMLEQMHDQIDAVIISTPDHVHFPMAMHAMLLGKHVYVEKPLAQNVYECRLLDETARQCGVVTQMGNQGHSDAGTIQFGQWVEAGLIKNVKKIDSWMTRSRRWHGWKLTEYPDQIPPIGYDWDLWLGRRPFRPHSDKLTDGNWRCWYDFGCGAMGDWGAHVLDAIHRYLKLGVPYEISTTLIGPSPLYYPQGSVITMKFKARPGMPPVELKWYDGIGNLPPKPKGYPKELVPIGSMVYLDKGVVTGTSGGANYHFEMNPELEKLQKEGALPKPKANLSNHYHNFLNACQGIEPATSPFDIAAPLSEMMCLGCIGQRFGGTLLYDAEAMKITNHPAADRMIKGPEVRDGWDAYDRQRLAISKTAQIKDPGNVRWENLSRDRDLNKWENPYDWGKAEYKNGVVHLTSEKGKWFLVTKKKYANFVFEGDVKMPVKAGNSGIQFRSQATANRVWGYQAEVDPSDRGWSGGLYDEGRRKWFISPNRDAADTPEERQASIAAFRARAGDCFKQGEWNTYRIECIGSHIQIYVNDTLTTDIHDEMDLSGHIGIQHHGEKGLVYQFRNLRIKDLGAGGDVYYPHREDARPPAVPSVMRGSAYEAENAHLVGCTEASDYTGYQGTGYVHLDGAGSFVKWDNVLAETTRDYILTFRYAAVNDSPCDLIVNGTKVGRIAFEKTESWTDWKTVDVKVSLPRGSNVIKVVAVKAGPNLDAVAVNEAR